MSALNIIRPDLQAFVGYPSAAQVGERPDIRLDANESPWAPNLSEVTSSPANRYPEPRPLALRQALSVYYRVSPENVLVTPGSDAGIDLLLRACCQAGKDRIVTSSPTFAMYLVAAQLQGAGVIDVPRRAEAEFTLDEGALMAASEEPGVRLIFLCSPNNPTGGLVPAGLLSRLCQSSQGRALVVVDEAYQEFSDTPGATELLLRYDNLVVLRTLSKAHALASIRCGALLADPELIDVLSNLLAPYPLPAQSIALANAAFTADAIEATHKRVANLQRLKHVLVRELHEVALVQQLLPGAANFILIKVSDAPGLLRKVADAGIQLRGFPGDPSLAQWLRVSVGSASENSQLLKVLRELS